MFSQEKHFHLLPSLEPGKQKQHPTDNNQMETG